MMARQMQLVSEDYPRQLLRLPRGTYKKIVEDQIKQFRADIKALKKEFGSGSRNYELQEMVFARRYALEIVNELSLFVLHNPDKNTPKVHDAQQLAQAWHDSFNVAYTQIQSPDPKLRRQFFQPKDDENARKDSAQFVDVLKKDLLLQQRLAILTDLEGIRSYVSGGFAEWDDETWFKNMVGTIGFFVLHYTSIEKMADPQVHPFGKLLLQMMADSRRVKHDINLRLLYGEDADSAVADERKEAPVVYSWFSLRALRQDSAWCHEIQTQIAMILKQLSNINELDCLMLSSIPQFHIQLLGGMDPHVFKIKCRDEQWMILRLYKHERDPLNIKAIQLLEEKHPDFIGQFFYSTHHINDAYCYAECSEFFGYGTLAQYIQSLHQIKGRGCFTLEQEQRFFRHFRQLLQLIISLHRLRVYLPDSKPTNFLFNADPLSDQAALVMSDLKSLSSLPEGQDTTHQIAYTLAYAAPEVLAGQAVNPYAQDVYALAMTFYEYLTGTVDLWEIQNYRPRDHFEDMMYGLLQRLRCADPVERLSYADFVNNQMERLEKRLFGSEPRRPSGGGFGAALFTLQQFDNPHSDYPFKKSRKMKTIQ